MWRQIALIGLAASVLAACEDPMAVSGPPKTASVSKSLPQERVLGTASSVIRTFHLNAEGKREEIGGVPCTVRSRHFSAKIVSPQRVNYPSFLQAARFEDRGHPGTLTVSCSGGGKSGAFTVDAAPANLATGAIHARVDAVYSDGTRTTQGGAFTAPIHSKQLASSYPWSYAGTIIVDLDP